MVGSKITPSCSSGNRQINWNLTPIPLKSPPGNRLEPLQGNRKGQHSIRINDQFRLCFVWAPDGIHDVKIVDYH